MATWYAKQPVPSLFPGGLTATSVGELNTANTATAPGDTTYDASSGENVYCPPTSVVAPATATQPPAPPL